MSEERKPKANAGGNLDPRDVYGRDRLIKSLWNLLKKQSILLNAERRMGKTQILKKMEAEPLEGWRPLYRDLENVHSAQEFSEHVYDDVQKFLGTTLRAKHFILKFLEDNETKYVNLKARTWKQLLKSAVEDLMASKRPEQFAFFWDEFPYMLANVHRNDGPEVAAEVFDTLRSLRMENDGFRTILSGSIGLHHVLRALTIAKIPTSAKNDTFTIMVTPLAPKDAETLAADLLQGEEIECDDLDRVAAVIAEEVDYFPYYIHHVVQGLKLEESAGTEANVKEYIARQLVDAADPWNLAHYRTRMSTYYPENNDAGIAIAIMDVLSLLPEGVESSSVDEIHNDVESRITDSLTRDRLLRLLGWMDADHYLSRDNDGNYSVRFPLIRRWWKLDRGL